VFVSNGNETPVITCQSIARLLFISTCLMFSGINYVQKSGTACNVILSLKLLHINSNSIIYATYRIQTYACQLCDANSHNSASLTTQPKHMVEQ